MLRIVIGVLILFPLALAVPLYEEYFVQPPPDNPYSFQVSVSLEGDRLVLTPNRTFSSKEKEELFRQTLLGAHQGDPILIWRAGVSYFIGFGVPTDERQAVDWWERAARRNVKWAHFALGWAHQFGRGGRQRNLDEARQSYEAAAKSLDPYFKAIFEEKLARGELNGDPLTSPGARDRGSAASSPADR